MDKYAVFYDKKEGGHNPFIQRAVVDNLTEEDLLQWKIKNGAMYPKAKFVRYTEVDVNYEVKIQDAVEKPAGPWDVPGGQLARAVLPGFSASQFGNNYSG